MRNECASPKSTLTEFHFGRYFVNHHLHFAPISSSLVHENFNEEIFFFFTELIIPSVKIQPSFRLG